MARSDLVLALAQAGNAGDRKKARVVTEAIIAEERAKRHTVLAEQLSKVVHLNSWSVPLVITMTRSRAVSVMGDLPQGNICWLLRRLRRNG